MSRVGKKVIEVGDKTSVDVVGSLVTVKGQKGQLQIDVDPKIEVKVEGKRIELLRKDDQKPTRERHGLFRALLSNMLIGVNEGFEKELEIVGVGYRAQMQGKNLSFTLGYSHPVEIAPPAGISFSVEGTNKVKVSGIEKQKVGQMAAELRNLRKPEPYKGKGVKYVGEKLKRKQGKSVKK